jgi:biotin carboxylase
MARAPVLLLCSKSSYRTDDVLAACRALHLPAVVGVDRCHVLAGQIDADKFPGVWARSLALSLRDLDAAARDIVAAGPFSAVLPTCDLTAELAALVAEPLGLNGNNPAAAHRARNKRLLRQSLVAAGVPTPPYTVVEPWADAPQVDFPVVVKPLMLSMSRGVERADDPPSLAGAIARTRALLATPELADAARRDPDGARLLVERFIPGPEVAVDGILSRGRLGIAILFDKPDPLDGPTFAETLYITPSRHPAWLQRAIVDTVAQACAAIGLSEGPIHAELRLGSPTPVVLELAARSIGGLCARMLRFGLGDVSLEELVLRTALSGEPPPARLRGASGALMLPVLSRGVLRGVDGIDAARAVPGIEDVVITVEPGTVVTPLPEGSAYLGFVFARAADPATVETALRTAWSALVPDIRPTL